MIKKSFFVNRYADGSDQHCDQYYLNKDSKWVKIGNYDRFSENATKILASNLDVYDKDGNLILKKTAYGNIDWEMIQSYS